MTAFLKEPIWQDVQKSYSFPIAFVLRQDVLEAKTPYEQANGLIRLFNTALQYAALVAASNYAKAPFKDEQVSYRFERLKRPLVSDFANFLRVSVPALLQHGELFVPELASSVEVAEKERVKALRMGERGFEEREMSLLEALINLRNALSHERFRGQWEAFVSHHAPLVARFLQLMDWCAKYPLLRLVGSGQMVRLMGSETTFTTEPIPDAALNELARTQREGELTGLMLADPTLSRFMTLYPFILWSECPYCEQEPLLGLTEEVFLFNGDEGRYYLAYIGVRHSRPMSPPKQLMEEIYAEKEVPPKPVGVSQLTYPVLYERAYRQSEIWLNENIIARRYIPQVYHPRKEIESELEAFLRGSKVGFLLLGEAGIGKTNLLCRKVEEWRKRGEIVLFYAGHQLLVSGEGEITAEPLENRIMRDLHLTGDFLELLDFLSKEGRRLILVVDGVNENPNAPALLRYLCNFVMRYASPMHGRTHVPTLKLIMSFRSAFFQKTLQSLLAHGGDEASLFPSSAFQTHTVEEQGRKVETYKFTLERVDEEELEAIYEGYRAYEGRVDIVTGEIVRFRPTTPFASLTPSVRRVLTHPWYLRMVMEAYDGKPIPQTLWTGEILEAFCRAKIYGSTPEQQERFEARARLVEELVSLMRQRKTDTFYRDELHDLSPHWSRILLESEIARSPYLQLVDEGVLMEVPETETVGRRTRTRYLIRFAFDPLFEYLLSDEILREVGGWEKLTGEYLSSLLEKGKEFDHLVGAVELLLTEIAQQRNFALLADTLNTAPEQVAASVFVRLLMTLEGMGHENFQPLVEYLAQNAETKKALSVLLQASYEFGTKQRNRPFLICSDTAQRVAHKAVKEGKVELANDLASAIVNKGVALFNLGRLLEAIECYDEAIRVFRRLIEEEGRVELVNELASAIMNKGVALDDLGRLLEAIECYDEAIRIRRRLVEEDGRVELANELARTLINKGNALVNLGCLLEAIKHFDEAMVIIRRLVEEEGRIELATALMSKGVALDNLGHPLEAIKCFDEAIGIFRRLVEEEGRVELANELASAITNKGNALANLGRLLEAIKCYDEAIRIRRRLVEEEGRVELANELAGTLTSKGIALDDLGHPLEAIKCYDEAIRIRRRLVEEEGRVELANELARTIMNKGAALVNLGRLPEAIKCFDEAIGIFRRLVEEEGRVELANELARTLTNKGIALRNLGRLLEAIECYDEAIRIRRRLVEEEGRVELANELARTIMNKGNVLFNLGRLLEAIECYDEAIRIRRRLVEEEGRVELANELARTIMNKGAALVNLGRLPEAIKCFDEAIGIFRRLVEEEGRVELANELAGVFMNKGVALERLEQWQDALDCYNESIRLWEQMVQGGMTHLMPYLVRTLRIRFNLWRRLSIWEAAAGDLVRALSYAIPVLQSSSPPEPLVREFENFLQLLRELTPNERAQLYAALGEWAGIVRRLIEG